MFCIKSDVITLGSIEMYGLVTVWTSMDDEPYWVTLLKYGSHGMRHTGFRRLTVVNRNPLVLGCHIHNFKKLKVPVWLYYSSEQFSRTLNHLIS